MVVKALLALLGALAAVVPHHHHHRRHNRPRPAHRLAYGEWAIPRPIVMCESGGRNLPPNGDGASGYYQIIPPTWRSYGGVGSAAYLTGKSEQDTVAARIWRLGGPSQWDCARLVAW